jgi:hypothetical protein
LLPNIGDKQYWYVIIKDFKAHETMMLQYFILNF